MSLVAIFGGPVSQGFHVLARVGSSALRAAGSRRFAHRAMLAAAESVRLAAPVVLAGYFFSFRAASSSSSIVMPLLYSLCSPLASPLRTWAVT